jgi:hypothetical protein
VFIRYLPTHPTARRLRCSQCTAALRRTWPYAPRYCAWGARPRARPGCLCLTQATKIRALELGGSKSITRYIHLHIDFPQTILHSKSLIFLREDLLILQLYMDFPITILYMDFLIFMLYVEFPMFISSGILCIIFTLDYKYPKDYRRIRASLICKPAPPPLKIVQKCLVP